MTVPATSRRAGPYTGNGVTLTFPFSFKVFSAADIRVDLATAAGVASVGVLNTDYTVSVNVDQTTTPGGTVSYAVAGVVTALPTGYTLAITGSRAYSQTTTLPTGGAYQASVVEAALDSLEMQVQQLDNETSRALTLSPLAPTMTDTTLPAPAANKLIAWNQTATGLQNVDTSTLASVVAFGTAASDQFTGTGAQTAFTLTNNPGALNNLRVAVGGVVQRPTTDYTWASGTTLTFTTAPPAGASILVQYMQALPQGTSDSAASTFVQAGTGAVSRTVQDKVRELVSVKDFGAAGDGVTDDTATIQAAITYARQQGGIKTRLRWNTGTYKVTSTLTLGSSQHIDFDTGVTVNLVPSANVETTSLFAISNQSNVTLIGNGALLNGTRTGAVVEGNAAAFYVYGSDYVLIQGFNITNLATDGITLTGDTGASGPCRNVTIQDVNVDNPRRNGMSIIHAQNVKVVGGRYTTANGAPAGPWAGIDVEPNAGQTIENVELIGVYTSGNIGGGLLFVPLNSSSAGIGRFEVSVLGGKSLSDGDINGRAGVRFINGANLANKCIGKISIRDMVIDSPLSNGVNFQNWDADKAPRVVLQSVTVINPDSTSVAGTNDLRVAYSIYHTTADVAPTMGNISMVECASIDTRGASNRMIWGCRLNADTGRQLKDIKIIDQITFGAVSALPLDVLASAEATAAGMTGVDVVSTTAKTADVSVTTALAGYAGRRINVTASSTNQTLPTAANCVGRSIEIQNAAGVQSTQVFPQAGDTIGWPINIAGTALVLDEGGFVRLRSLGGTTWEIESLAGRWRQQGQSKATRVVFTTASPSTGTWAVGDIAINATPAVGSPKGWRCTAAGTPGTWVSEGNL